jgi:hypothetical protein
VREADRSNYIICGSSATDVTAGMGQTMTNFADPAIIKAAQDESQQREIVKMGLVSDHAYAIL